MPPGAVAYGRIGVSTQAYGSLCQYLLQLINIVTGNLDREGGALANEARDSRSPGPALRPASAGAGTAACAACRSSPANCRWRCSLKKY